MAQHQQQTQTWLWTALGLISLVTLTGTFYSIANNTYMDTSNPLLTNLPHPLHKTHYFAAKSNVLNVYFIKNAWAWTSTAFIILWATSPPSKRTAERVAVWFVETAAWALFTSWFFGPAVFERIVVASGGECIVHIPTGDHFSVPMEYCFTKSTISPATHPSLFATTASLLPPANFHATPRLRKGHDVSGHIFLLTMSILFLVDQLRHSYHAREAWNTAHKVAIALNGLLIAAWLFASWTTSVYFHSPQEKLSGLRELFLPFGPTPRC
jgi:hypothetical protein